MPAAGDKETGWWWWWQQTGMRVGVLEVMAPDLEEMVTILMAVGKSYNH